MGSTALLAAGAAGLRPAFAQDENHLRIMFWGGQARADRTYGVADLFAKANPGFAYDGEFLAFNDYWPKLTTQIAGGNAPDILQMDYRFIVEYAHAGTIAPLDEFLGGALDVSTFDPATVAGGSVDGKLYGVSLGANSAAMIMNTTMFEEAGVPMPDQSTTWDDYARITAEITKAGKREGLKGAQDGSGVEPALENWLRQRGKALYTADGQAAFDAADISEWFEMWNKMREAGSLVSAEDQAASWGGGPEANVMTLGKAAVAYEHSNLLLGYQALNKEPLTITNYPRVGADGKGGHYRKPSQFFSIGGTSTKKELAAKLISFYVNDLEAGKILGVERGVPESSKVREALVPTLDAQSQVAVAYVANLGDLAGPQSVIRTISEEVAFGSRTPSEAGPALMEAVNEVLARKT
jgi:multiple sugar transport system substrate-binding protein